VLEVKTLTFTVKRHIRPKSRCLKCGTIAQAPAPDRPLDRSYAGASLLALILVWKYGYALPLYRQCQIFAHAGYKVSRSTVVGWVAGSSALLGPLVEALARHVLAGWSVNGDDTPVKVLAPGTGKTKKGHLWTYVRDGTNWGSTDPPAVGTATRRPGMGNILKGNILKRIWPLTAVTCKPTATRALSRCSSRPRRISRRVCWRSAARTPRLR